METIFLSYSRVDAAFALKLAEDLKNSGTGVWIDQASIKAGNRWDASIEAALIAASRLIIVLSPAAVASNNVMDEVSFALENKKIVIPVLLAECAAPFRLRRLQRIDFTKDYRSGLRELLEALSEQLIDHDQEVEEIRKQRIKESESKRLSKKYFIVSACLLLAVIIIWILVNNIQNKSAEANGWRIALNKNDSSSYESYLKNFPSGSHREQAIKKMDSISLPEKQVAINPLRDSIAGNKNPGNEYHENTKLAGSKKEKQVLAVEKTEAPAKKIAAPKPEVGKPYQGGIVYFLDSTGEHGLIVAEKELKIQDDDNTVHTQFTYEQSIKVCSDLVLNGYDDWYLPGKAELNKLYRAREMLPSTLYLIKWYWSSTEEGITHAWQENFANGAMTSYYPKYSNVNVRAIRAF